MTKIFLLILFLFLVLSFPSLQFVAAQQGVYDPGGRGSRWLNIIGEYGFEREGPANPEVDLVDVIFAILNAVLSFLGIIFLVLVIYGGFVWMFSGGDETKITKARNIIANSVLGVIVILASVGITQLVFDTLNKAAEESGGEEFVLQNISVMDIIVGALNGILSLFGVFFLGLMIYGGYMWMFSGGEEQRLNKARKILVSAAIGAVIVLLSFAFTRWLFGAMGVL